MSTLLNTANTLRAIEEVTVQAMTNTLEAFQKKLDKMHTGRASPALLENIRVPQPQGGSMLLSHMARITLIDAQTLMVAPWDKSLLQTAQKAIMQSELGLNPVPQGEALRVPLPPLSEKRRQDMVKMISNIMEEMREEVRNHRRSANTRIKTLAKGDNAISEDEERRLQSKIQKLTDDYIKSINALSGEKEQKILGG